MLYNYRVPTPKIAILIPTKNGGANIASTVASATGQGDIYVINDGSTDNTAAVATAAGAFLVDMPENIGKALAIRTTLDQHFDHLGGQRMPDHYDYIMVLDDDMLLTPDFTDQCLAVMAKDKVVAVEGHCDVHWPADKMWNVYLGTRAITYWRNQRMIQRVQSWFGIRTWLNGACVLYTAEVLDAVVRPEPFFVTEDTDWRWQIHRRKMGKVKYAPRSQCDQQQPTTWKATYRQQLRWAWGNFQLVMEHGIGRRASLLDFAFIVMLFDLVFSIFWPILAIQGAHKLHVSIFTLVAIGFGYYAIVGVITAYTLQRWRLLLMWPFAPFADMVWKVVTIHGFFKALKEPRIERVTWTSPERVALTQAAPGVSTLSPAPAHTTMPVGHSRAPHESSSRFSFFGRFGRDVSDRMVIAVGAVGAFIVGMIGIGTRPFWLDESFSYWFPRQSLNAFVDVSLHQELNMVAHYFVMGTWGRILDGAVGVRLFSVVCFAIGAAVIGLLARELHGSRAVIPAMILWIVNAPALRYAQEARGYMMATVAVTASALCLVRHIKSGRRRPLLGFALFGALSVYSHMFALLAMVGLCTAALWYAWPRQNRRVVVRGVTTFALLCVPLLVFLSQAETAQIGWVKYQHRTIQNVLEFLSGGGYERMLIVIACCGVGTYIWFQCRRNRRYVGFTYLLPAAWLIATVLGAFIINMKKPIILDRYFMVAAPAAVLVVAGQIARARVRRDGLILGTVAIVAVCLFSVRAIESTYKDHGTVNWNKVSAYVAQHSNGDDQLVVLPRFERSPFDFAWKDQGLRAEFLVPASPATEIGVMSNDAKTAGDVPIGTAARSKVLVVISPGEEPGFESELAKLAPMKMTHEENFGSITVREYSP